MAILSFTSPTIWAGLSDLSNDANEVSLEYDVAALDATTFASGGWMANVGGLRSGKLDIKGFFDAGTADLPDDLGFANLGVSGVPITVTPAGASVGTMCYFGSFMEPSQKIGGKVGDLLSFETNGSLDSPIVRGQVANFSARTATATTTSLQLTAPTANQRVYCALHVLTVSGTGSPTLTAVLQGDNATGFPSPATVATSTAITAPGAQLLKGAVGVTADNWYRLSLTITGTSPSFLLYAAIGVA